MKEILFVCVHNAGRSQMAEAFFNHFAQGRAQATSAGTHPATEVHPIVVQAMREVGIDLTGRTPKLLTRELIDRAEKVITMGCFPQEACPMTFVPTEDWGLEDPAGQPLEKVREIRDAIQQKVLRLLEELGLRP